VAEQLLHDLGVHAGVQRERGAGVPGVVQPDDRHTGRGGGALE
jgi:hypothetical protein